MKRSTKITTIIIIFFFVIAAVIVARTMVGNHFKKKFSKRQPPGIIVTEVVEKKFSETIESFGTAISKKTETFRIKKNNLTSDLNLKNEQTQLYMNLIKEEFEETAKSFEEEVC